MSITLEPQPFICSPRELKKKNGPAIHNSLLKVQSTTRSKKAGGGDYIFLWFHAREKYILGTAEPRGGDWEANSLQLQAKNT